MAPRSFEDDLVRRILQVSLKQHMTAEVKRLNYRVNADIMNGAIAAARQGTRGVNNGVRSFASGLQQNLGNPADLDRLHTDVAKTARSAVRRSFGQSVKTQSGQYRVGGSGDTKKTTKGGFLSRYSGGALKRAISNPSLAVGTARGISFVDEGRLTREAAHWARLNFGAAPHQRTRRVYRVLFDGRVVANLGFNASSRPAFYLPPGYWRGKDGGAPTGSHDQFFLSKNPKFSRSGTSVDKFRTDRNGVLQFTGSREQRTGQDKERTRGIRPREFLDAGLQVIARELPIGYMQLLDAWRADAALNMKLPPKVIVSPGTGRLSAVYAGTVSGRPGPSFGGSYTR